VATDGENGPVVASAGMKVRENGQMVEIGPFAVDVSKQVNYTNNNTLCQSNTKIVFKQMGIGKTILSFAHSLAPKVMVEVCSARTDSLVYYGKLGFKESHR